MEKIIKNKMFENHIKSNDYKMININKYLVKEKFSKLNLFNFKIRAFSTLQNAGEGLARARPVFLLIPIPHALTSTA